MTVTLRLGLTKTAQTFLTRSDIDIEFDKPFLQEVSPQPEPDPLSAKLAEEENSVKYDQATQNVWLHKITKYFNV